MPLLAVPSSEVTDGELLTVQEVATLLKMNPETVRRWLRDGKLRGYLLGGDRAGYRVAADDLDAFIRARGTSLSSNDSGGWGQLAKLADEDAAVRQTFEGLKSECAANDKETVQLQAELMLEFLRRMRSRSTVAASLALPLLERLRVQGH